MDRITSDEDWRYREHSVSKHMQLGKLGCDFIRASSCDDAMASTIGVMRAIEAMKD